MDTLISGRAVRYDTIHSRGDSSLDCFQRRMETMRHRLSELCGCRIEIVRYEGSLEARDLRCIVAHVA